MMKKICLLVAFFVLGKMWSYAQYPITQTLGSDSTIVISKGALQSRLINVTYTDTTAANLQRIRQYPGAQIATTTGGLNLWIRNANATAWIPVATGSGNNIYTIDGTLLGNRTLTGANYSLTFNQLSKLLFNADSTTVNTDQATISNNGVSTLNVKGATGRIFLMDTTAPADEKIYELKSSNGEFYISILNDAQTTNDSAFLITSASRVGINTTSTDSTLKVGGGVNILGGLRVGNLPTSPGTKQLRINAQGQLSVTDTLIDAGGTVTSVGTNNGSGITGGPITTTGTLAIDTTNVIATKASVSGGLAGKLNISDTASMLSPYLRSNSAAATYVPLTRTLTINGTTQDLSANRTYNVGTVTSVGLTMPAAFNVANSPVTSSGTLAVTGAGLASQYIRGDGTLADFPGGGGGGGASISYYLNGSVNQGTFGGNTYYEMNKVPIFGAGTNFSINADGYIAQFITDAGDPGLLNIPAGNWNFELFFNASSSGGSPTYYVELYKYDGTTFTLIASGSTNPDAITGGTSVDAYFSTLPVPQTILTLTDRLAVRIYVTHSGRTITLHTEDNNLCQIITTFTTGITALNGLTEQVQYFTTGTSGTDFNISSSVATHTFNLPTASATNRGALSTTDWTTFNSKLSPADTVSLSNRINLKLNISDTASMLGNYLNNVGYGLSKAGQVASADSATLSAYYLRRKDSLTATNPLGYVTKKILSDTAAAIRSSDLGGTVTSVATNNGTGITGGTITTSGTLAIDTLLVSTRAWRQKGVDSVAALANTKISGSLISGYLTKATGSLTIDTSQIYQNGQNVGIGTIVPDGRLAIVDTGGFALKIMYNSASTDANTNAALYAENNGLSSYVTIFNEKTTNNTGGQFPLLVESSLTSGTAQSGMATGIHFGVPDDAGNRKVTQLAVRTTNAAAATYTNRAELRLWNNGSLSTPYYLLGNGNMGLGTSTPDSNLTVVNGALFQRGVRMSALPQAPGTKALRIDASGTISYADTLIDAGGTVTSVATNNGTGITGGTITTTGTLAIDTLLISTRAWRQKGIDSVAALLPAAISGTTNYIPKFTSSSAIGNSVIYESSSNIGIGTTSPTQKLDVVISSGPYNSRFYNSSTSTSEYNVLLFSQGASGSATGYLGTGGSAVGGAFANNFVIGTQSNNALVLSTNDFERLRISSTGNVSIGGTTASSIFNINGVDPLISFQNGGTTKWQVGLENTSSDRFIWYNNAGAAYRMILDASGNLGLGVSPSAWGSGYTALQVKNSGFMSNDGNLWMYANGYFDGSSNKYIQNGYASRYYQYNSGHYWDIAPSGTAGNAISFTQAMTLGANGNLLVGTTTDAGYKLTVAGLGRFVGANTAFNFGELDANNIYFQALNLAGNASKGFVWYGTSEYMRLNASGNLGLGVSPSNAFADSRSFEIGANGILWSEQTSSIYNSMSIGSNFYYNAAGSTLYKNTGVAASRFTQYQGSHIWFQAPSGTAGNTISFTQAMTLDASGNLGLGTTNPSGYGSGYPTMDLRGSTGSGIKIGNSTDVSLLYANSTATYLRTSSVKDLILGTNDTERMRITSGGDVGIGTTSPQYKTQITNTSANNVTDVLALHNGVNPAGGGTGARLIFKLSNFESTNEIYKYASIEGLGTNDYNENVALVFRTQNSAAGLVAPTEKMRINGNGNVGIGTTSPSAKLHIGESGAAAQLWLQRTDGYNPVKLIGGTLADGSGFKITMNTTDAFAITSGGNVGIGTTSPNSILQIKGAFNIERSSTTDYSIIDNEGNLNLKAATGGGGGSFNTVFFTNGSERMRITSGGNVGIGTTSPQTKLVVIGGNSNAGLEFDNTSTATYIQSYDRVAASHKDLIFYTTGSPTMTLKNTGELLINTTTDAGAYYLQVNGDVYAGAYYESSDRRLKDILSARGGSDGINTVTFKWKDQRDSLSHIGYIAQEVEKVLPDAVKTNPNGYKTINYDEVQSLKIANLEQEIAELKKVIKQLIDKK